MIRINLLKSKVLGSVIAVSVLLTGCVNNTTSVDTDAIAIDLIGSQKARIENVYAKIDEGQLKIKGALSKKFGRRGKILGHIHIEAFDNAGNLLSKGITDYRRRHHKTSHATFSYGIDALPERVARIQVVHHGSTGGIFKGNNPLPSSSNNISAGKAIFEQNCKRCHGISGKGDGDDGQNLKRRPADVAGFAKTAYASDEYLFWMIYEGGDAFKTGMPSFGGNLTDQEIWQTITYLRRL